MIIETDDLKAYSIAILTYVRDCLEKGFEQADKKELVDMLLLVIEDVKISDPSFKANFHKDSINNHHGTLLTTADRYLNKLYSDIETVVSQIKGSKTNKLVCIKKLNKMIDTNLYMDFVQEIIDKASSKQEGIYEVDELKISDREPGEYPCDME